MPTDTNPDLFPTPDWITSFHSYDDVQGHDEPGNAESDLLHARPGDCLIIPPR